VRKRLTALDHLAAALVAGAYLALLVGTAHDLGFTRDEGFYFDAADDYARWFQKLWEDPGAATTREAVDAGWRRNHEHPPLMKSLFGLSNSILHERFGLFDEASTAYRFPGMLASAMAVWLTFLFGAAAYSRTVGAFAAAAFALAPRPFFHAHLACFDMAITTATLAVTFAYWKSIESKAWGIAAGLLLGLAMLVKHNAFFLPAILGVHYLVVRLRDFHAARLAGDAKGVPVSFVAALVLAPAVYVGGWPWLWFETVKRFRNYVGFHTNHPFYNIEYLGTTWFEPPLPISYPFGMTLFTWPLVTLVLCVIGLGFVVPKLLPGPIRKRLAPSAAPDDRRTDLLVVWSALVPMAIIAHPSVPIFGGTKHWLPAMPFVCILAGVGFERALGALRVRVRGPRPLLAAALAAALLAAPAIETRASHPFALSHYTAGAGGTPGAADIGTCRQFWGFTTGSLTGWLNRHVRRGGAVQLHDTLWQSYRMLQRDGRLRRDIRYAPDAARSDFALVHLEQHWSELEYAIWDDYGTAAPAHVLTHEGVPIVPVYANPVRRR